jgi:predicted ATPase
MIASIFLCFNHKRRVSSHRRFTFVNGFNVIVGPNGSGKSTLTKAIYKCRDCKRQEDASTRYHYFNGETMNPHKAYKYFKSLPGSVIRVRALFSSHGETMRDVLKSYNPQPGDCFILDEPETGHDLEWVIKIRKGLDALVKEGCQVIVASHHPVFWHKSHVIELKKNYLKYACRLMKISIAEDCRCS